MQQLQQLVMQSVITHGTEISTFPGMAVRAYRQHANPAPARALRSIIHPPRCKPLRQSRTGHENSEDPSSTPLPQPHIKRENSEDTRVSVLPDSETIDRPPSFQTLRKNAGYTDLLSSRQMRSLSEIPRQYAQLVDVFTHCKNIVIIAGAGISTSAGSA
jgi:hypothetical protein